MRMTVRVVLGVLTIAFGTLLLLGAAAGPATAAGGPDLATARPLAAHVVVIHTSTAPVTTAPAAGTGGTNYNQGQQTANAAMVRRKAIMAVICAVLLVIVYFGHKAKYKHILRLKNLQNAKS